MSIILYSQQEYNHVLHILYVINSQILVQVALVTLLQVINFDILLGLLEFN